jgi:hypothetical protein
MDDELRMLNEAMIVKERLRVLAELQASYWRELLAQGFDQPVAEQLMMDWSRHAYGMTFRELPDASLEDQLEGLLGSFPAQGAQPTLPPSSSLSPSHRDQHDPSSVPPGEPWLQLVQDEDLEDLDDESDEQRAA